MNEMIQWLRDKITLTEGLVSAAQHRKDTELTAVYRLEASLFQECLNQALLLQGQ